MKKPEPGYSIATRPGGAKLLVGFHRGVVRDLVDGTVYRVEDFEDFALVSPNDPFLLAGRK